MTPVCEKVLETAASVVCTYNVPLEILLHFISSFPREFTDYGGKFDVFLAVSDVQLPRHSSYFCTAYVLLLV